MQLGERTLYRRIGRRGLQLVRPLALPFLLRLKRWISLGVDESRSAQLLQQLLTRQNEIAARLERMATEMQSLQSAIAGTRDEQRVRLEGLAATMLSLQQSIYDQASPIMTLLSEQGASGARLDGLGLRIDKANELAAIAAQHSSKLLQARALPFGDEVFARSPFGWLLLPASDLALVEMMLETGGAPEPGTSAVVQALLEPNDLAVDVGAHVGALTLAMARRVGPSGHVIAIEPTPRTAALLRRTCAVAGLEQTVRIEECAAGAGDGRAALSIGATSGHNSLLPLARTAGNVEVDVRPLDTMLPAGAVPALVKIDAEGFELEVWHGMRRLVREAPDLAVIVELDRSHLQRLGVTVEVWLAALTAPGFVPYEIHEASGMIRPLCSSGLQNAPTMNVLLLRHPPSRWPRLRIAA